MFENELITQALVIAAMGMGIVISFLCILIFAMSAMAKVIVYINKICPVAVVQSALTQKVALNDDSIIAAVIAAAKKIS